MITTTIQADALRVGDTILIAEGQRTIAKVIRDDPVKWPDSVVMTVNFEGYGNTPFHMGIHSQQTLVRP